MQPDWAFVAGAQTGDSLGPGLIMCLTSGKPPPPQGGRLTWLPALGLREASFQGQRTSPLPPLQAPKQLPACRAHSGGERGAWRLLSQALKAQKSPGGLLSNLLPPTPWRRQSSEGAARGQECSQPLGGDAGRGGLASLRPAPRQGRTGWNGQGVRIKSEASPSRPTGSLSPGFWYRIPVTQPEMGTKVPLAYGIAFRQGSFPQH